MTAFLVLLATGSRRGEVHAFNYAKVHPSKKWTDITLEPHSAFVAKTELKKTGASVFSPVRIPALVPILGPGLGRRQRPLPSQSFEDLPI